MPNWVYNNVVVTGDPVKVGVFVANTTAPHPVQKFERPDGKFSVTVEGEFEYSDGEFSFWNVIAPPVEKWSEYFATSGIIANVKYGETPYNWYNWNISNWGTKWDACDVELSYAPGEGEAAISFNTAWSPPIEVIVAMVEMYPELHFTVDYREEQGWGGRITATGGSIVDHLQWDIPDGHDEWMKTYGYCELCDWSDCENGDGDSE